MPPPRIALNSPRSWLVGLLIGAGIGTWLEGSRYVARLVAARLSPAAGLALLVALVAVPVLIAVRIGRSYQARREAGGGLKRGPAGCAITTIKVDITSLIGR